MAAVAEPLLPPAPKGGSPEPPSVLPPERACQGAASSWASLDALPGQVDGNRIRGAQGLRELRRAWGDAPVVVGYQRRFHGARRGFVAKLGP